MIHFYAAILSYSLPPTPYLAWLLSWSYCLAGLLSKLAGLLAELLYALIPTGYALGPIPITKKDSVVKEVTLRWSTPKTTSMDFQFCTSAYRVTPSNVRPHPAYL